MRLLLNGELTRLRTGDRFRIDLRNGTIGFYRPSERGGTLHALNGDDKRLIPFKIESEQDLKNFLSFFEDLLYMHVHFVGLQQQDLVDPKEEMNRYQLYSAGIEQKRKMIFEVQDSAPFKYHEKEAE